MDRIDRIVEKYPWEGSKELFRAELTALVDDTVKEFGWWLKEQPERFGGITIEAFVEKFNNEKYVDW